MKKWEYAYKACWGTLVPPQLNLFGALGWELVSVHQVGSIQKTGCYELVYTFKRPLKTKRKRKGGEAR